MEFIVEEEIECQKWMERKDRGWHWDEKAGKSVYNELADYPKALIHWRRKKKRISRLYAIIYWSSGNFDCHNFCAYKGESMKDFEKRLMEHINAKFKEKNERAIKALEAQLAAAKGE